MTNFLEIIPHYDALIVRGGTTVSKAIIEAGQQLRIIARAGIGVENIDMDAANSQRNRRHQYTTGKYNNNCRTCDSHDAILGSTDPASAPIHVTGQMASG